VSVTMGATGGSGALMRRGSRHERGWIGWYEYDGGVRQGAERRSSWDLRCQEARCARVNGRKSARTLGRPGRMPRRRRRAGGRFR
jgi:hypothetical protein